MRPPPRRVSHPPKHSQYIHSIHTGAYQSLVSEPLPSPDSPDYTPTLIYQARAHIALSHPSAALSLLSSASSVSENLSVKAANALARYVEKPDESALEELRDLAVEVEDDEGEVEERERWTVRVLAATAFARAGEVEEALETVQAGTQKTWLEA